MSVRVYLSLGSNLGQRAAHLRAALRCLPPKVQIERVSPIYETAPWGYTDQPAFLNQVVEARTDLSPVDLLAYLKQMEMQLGRQITFRYGPRQIDIDILFYGNESVKTELLTIPHAHLAERAFVLAPLNDLTPDLIHPVFGQSIAQLLRQVDASGVQRVMTHLPAFGTRTFVMGILNITPDSFSGDGILQRAAPQEVALAQAQYFIACGVDILDIGGESTRPNAPTVTEEQELERVLPVIRLLAQETDCLLSIDTYKARVAEAALQAGADWVNDVWGLRADPEMAAVVARHNAPVILMHNRLKPTNPHLLTRLGDASLGASYTDLLEDVKRELLQSVSLARQAGIPEENILLDPGIGFGKSVTHNLELINRLDEIAALGYPVLLAPSRKSFIGQTLGLPADQRLEGTLASISLGIARGADIVRVHDAQEAVRTARMMDALLQSSPWR